ncbi:hypothetical protein C8R44DRAFT_893174 [Mycena epipterygia]|nr:hypothetical protein C8R44DRAFT_893174 [Mycena epipterygia]
MRLPFSSRVKRKPLPSSLTANPATASTIPDVLWTSLLALKESADAFPPLKTVGGVVALLEIAERAKHYKSDARAIALRTKEILDLIADAVPMPQRIPCQCLRVSSASLCPLLDEIRCRMETITLTGGVSRVMHLNRNERVLQNIKAQLDDAYRDFLAASALRLEVQHGHLTIQQTQLAAQQVRTHTDVGKASTATQRSVRRHPAWIEIRAEERMWVFRLGSFVSGLESRVIASGLAGAPRVEQQPTIPISSPAAHVAAARGMSVGCIRLHSPAIPPFSSLSLEPSPDALSFLFIRRARPPNGFTFDKQTRASVTGTYSPRRGGPGAGTRAQGPARCFPRHPGRSSGLVGVQQWYSSYCATATATQAETQAHASASGSSPQATGARRVHDIALALRMHPQHLALGGVAHVLVVGGARAALREGEQKLPALLLPVKPLKRG